MFCRSWCNTSIRDKTSVSGGFREWLVGPNGPQVASAHASLPLCAAPLDRIDGGQGSPDWCCFHKPIWGSLPIYVHPLCTSINQSIFPPLSLLTTCTSWLLIIVIYNIADSMCTLNTPFPKVPTQFHWYTFITSCPLYLAITNCNWKLNTCILPT